MRKFRLPIIAFIVLGMLNLLAFVYIACHREYVPASYSQDYLSDSNIRNQIPAGLGRMP
jgi:hypothetical protein